MKKNFLITLLTLAMISFSAIGLASCGGNGGNNGDNSSSEPPAMHTHVWNEYISKQATCDEKGEVLYSCDCGESYTAELPIDSDKHNVVDEACVDCGKTLYSEVLEYTLSDDGMNYIVTGIGDCTDTMVVIPSKYNSLPVTSIGEEAFYNCDRLTSVTIPDGVTSIGNSVFAYCRSLTSIEVNENNVNYSSLDGNLYNKDKTELIQYAIGKTATSFTIPDSVTSIGDDAFALCSRLTSVTIGNSVTSIGDGAFYYCYSLTSVTIGNGVTSIGDGAFENCFRLTSVTIGNGVTSIGNSAFFGCSNLTSVTIPDGVTSIGNSAFAYCRSLTSIEVNENNVNYSSLDGNLYNKDKTELIQYAIGKTATSFTIPDSVTSIGDDAFALCSRLTSVTIPDSVTSIGDDAFALCSNLTSVMIPDSVTSIGENAFHCESLTSIEVDGNNANYSSLDGNLYNKDQTELIQYAIGKAATSFTIPDSVTSIGDFAFCDCFGLTSVTIGNSVTSIGDYAFFNCINLMAIAIPDSVTSIGDSAFSYCESLTSITFNGTVEEWNAIEKGNDWNYGVPAKEVVCTGGIVSLQ